MGKPTIENVRGLGDFMVSNAWDINIIGAGSVFEAAGLNFRAVSCELPKRSGNSLEVNIRGQKIKQPGDYDYSGTITITLAEGDNAEVHQALTVLRELTITTGTNHQLPKSNVESVITIKRLNRQGDPIHGFALRGCYLEDYDLGELTDAGDIVQPTVTFSYDYFVEI